MRLLRVLSVIIAPLLSLIIATLGNGLFNTLVTVRLNLEGQPTWIIGLATGAYYAGLIVGSFRSEHLISRVGHVRAYAVIASLLAAVSVLQGMVDLAWIDVIMRFISGICIAVIYVVVESWMLARGSRRMRGQILGVYMMALYASQATGQFFLNLSDPSTIIPFCIVALLTSLSVIPIALTTAKTPPVEEPSVLGFKALYRVSPSGMIGACVSGLILGPIYGLMPLFIAQQNYSVHHIALIMGMIIYGGMALQYPVGKFSDNFDRRKVFFWVSVLATLTAAIIGLFSHHSLNIFLAASFLFGGFTFTLYPLAVSLACDNVAQRDLIAATQGLLLAYGVGATIGPIIAPLFIKIFAANGLMLYFVLLGAVLSLFLGWQWCFGRPTNVSRQQDFVPLTRTSPIANELDPRSEQQ